MSVISNGINAQFYFEQLSLNAPIFDYLELIILDALFMYQKELNKLFILYRNIKKTTKKQR